MIRLGIEVVQQRLEWTQIRDRVIAAETLGFDGAWVFDHLRPIGGAPAGPCLEGWTLLAALAAVTKRIRLGTLVTGMTYRHPSMLAAEAVTIDHVSNGRIEIAVGAAWNEDEHRQFGLPFPSTRERAERLEEGIIVLKKLMGATEATFEGRYYRLQGAPYRPAPVQRPHPPIWIGAAGEKLMLPIVARQADVWHASASLGEMLHKSALIDRYAEQFGRDPTSIARAGTLRLDEDDDTLLRTADGFHGAGFSYLVCTWPAAGLDRVRTFVDRVLPSIRAMTA